VETTEWHRVTIWGKPAENAAKFLAKGSLVYIEGKLKTNTYEKDGQKHWVTEILATNVQYLSTKAENKENSERSGNSGSNSNSGNSNTNNSGRRPSNSGASNSGGFDEPPGSNEMPDFNDFGGNPGDDDIPF